MSSDALLLAGPMLRRTEAAGVTVWVALRCRCQVRLTVYDTQAGAQLRSGLMTGEATTCAIGQHLHLAVVTALPTADQRLEADRIYAYDLRFELPDGTGHTLAEALDSRDAGTISYFPHGLPTFALPPRRWQDLRLVHGSCRKPHAHGHDALPILDSLIAAAVADPRRRPHQVFFTGDQIYSDDVAEPFLWWANRLGSDLLGWQEQLPGGFHASDLKPGERAAIATQQGGFTAGMGNKTDKINSHLLGLGEFLATYLLYFSPACWPQHFPDRRSIRGPKGWNQQVERLQRFRKALPYVRRALANVPVYTIFDDHDVSDDWNLNQAWCLRVLGRPLGRRVVQNALLAYALIQGWGNTPDQFQPGQPGNQLLRATERWSASEGTDSAAWSAITQHLGLPPTNPLTSLPEFCREDGYLVLDRQPEALTWHYSLSSDCHRILALDSRTRRGFPADEPPLAPPQLLSASALDHQLETFLETDGAQQLTFVIAPTNLFSLKLLDWIQRFHLRHNKVFSTDVGDAWNLPTDSLAQFLVALFRQRQRTIVLSGDIHFSFAVQLTLESHDPTVNS
ncbi:PhoD-like phosphatase, partial [filamentous cyanobacterium CCP5]